ISGEGGDRELVIVGEFVGELLEKKDSDTQGAIGSMFKVVYSIDDEVREIECCGGSTVKDHIGFTSRQEIFININGTYDVLTNEMMCHFEISTYLFNKEIAWILKCEPKPV
nr:hypothetical protein [Tanacetum cinerariifolium]